MSEKISTKKAILLIVVSFVLYLVGALLSSLFTDLIFKFVTFENETVYAAIRHVSDFAFVFLLLWLCIYKIFRMKFEDFGIEASIFAIIAYVVVSLILLLSAKSSSRNSIPS